MSVLDELFSSRREEQYRTGATALEDRLLKFQRHLEERCRNEMKLEMEGDFVRPLPGRLNFEIRVARVKEDEVARIRLEEKENFRRELEKARKDVEITIQVQRANLGIFISMDGDQHC
ncbi:hypothetical protein DPMN_115045 [Dreissena polymorpha]|uniref:Uncharacterized protein n=1 Tax=Dreissena polymorpha TaxID=45954 RepID=A0A9D4KL74_DREPO|nr:hypothetical protein DPMN_115045 [Dreissena polymorpha]